MIYRGRSPRVSRRCAALLLFSRPPACRRVSGGGPGAGAVDVCVYLPSASVEGTTRVGALFDL